MHDINGLVNRYRAGLNVEVNDEKGSILTLSLTGPNKEQICDYLNKLSQVYIQSNLDEKNTTSSNTIRFIDDQLHEIIDSLQTAGVGCKISVRPTGLSISARKGMPCFSKWKC